MGAEIVVREEPVKPLSVAEQKRKEQLEGVVVANFQSFVTVGKALAEIRDRKLYRENYPTFERYCKELFDVARGTAYRHIAAAEVVENVSNWRQTENIPVLSPLPLNEAQVRPLTRLRPEQQVAVWQAAVDSAPKGKVTAAHVNKVVKNYLGEKVTATIRNAQAKVAADRHISGEFRAAFDAFLEQIQQAKDEGYKTTSRQMVVKCLDQLRAEIAEHGETIPEQAKG